MPISSARSSRRVSSIPSQPEIKAKRPAPAKPKRQSKTKNEAIGGEKSESSFVAGDIFDFSAAALESPKGPMTRSRRSSIFVGHARLNQGLPITSTRVKSVSKKSRLESVIETPINAIEDQEASFRGSARRKSSKNTNKSLVKESKVVISPIKKAALKQAFARQAIKIPSPTKKELPKLMIQRQKSTESKVQNAMPGTPQPFDPSSLLKRNLKKKVDLEMDKKIAEIPQNSSPYTLLRGETENGSPVEHFVKLNNKPSKENVTGTPAAKRSRAALRALDNNQQSSPHPVTRR